VAALEREVARLRSLVDLSAAASTQAMVRAASASHASLGAELRAVRAETALTQARDEVAGLRAELAALREELVWAFAARAAEPKLVDVTDAATRTA
jgi:predicted dithiol-disulfide oxidoreductase (DUF899 family)